MVVFSFGGMVLNIRLLLVVVVFSLRGFNMVMLEILKLDVIGLGVNILVVWFEVVGFIGLDKDIRKIKFNILLGIFNFLILGFNGFIFCLVLFCFYVSSF